MTYGENRLHVKWGFTYCIKVVDNECLNLSLINCFRVSVLMALLIVQQTELSSADITWFDKKITLKISDLK